jgi:hypothetical protein
VIRACYVVVILQGVHYSISTFTVLQAQRLAATEALIKMQPHAAGAAGAAGAGGDVEGRLKRLAADVRMLKERLGDAAAVAGGGSRSPGQVGITRITIA